MTSKSFSQFARSFIVEPSERWRMDEISRAKKTEDDDGYQAYHTEREFALSGLI